MERLTQRLEDGQVLVNCEHCEYHNKLCHVLFCRNRLKARLAAYEDTGLEPEEIITLRHAYDGLGRMFNVPASIMPERLREILLAEQEGRLAVLPCKVGAPVYRVGAGICKWREIDRCNEYCSGYEYEDCWEGGKEVLEEKFCLEMLDKVGKTVFLTREEAEAALKGGNENA